MLLFAVPPVHAPDKFTAESSPILVSTAGWAFWKQFTVWTGFILCEPDGKQQWLLAMQTDYMDMEHYLYGVAGVWNGTLPAKYSWAQVYT